MTRAAGAGVCFVSDRSQTGGRPLLEVVQAALAGGADVVQVREKDLGGAALLEIARAIVLAARNAGGRSKVIVNDRLDVAVAAKAAGVHLPAAGLPIDGTRRQTGRKFLIGRSVHALAEARLAEKQGADYLIFGPVFATPSKASFGPPLGPAALRKVAESVRIPVWAIGGIDATTAAELRGIPLAGVAVVRAIASAPDPALAIGALRAALQDLPPVS